MYKDKKVKDKCFLLIDWKKAFDSVPQKLLLKWIWDEMTTIEEEEFYKDAIRGYKLSFNNSKLLLGEEVIEVKKGVPQGSCLSPLLFIKFMDVILK
jgi:uncharacterized protein YcgL (UPF0745 family)